MLTNKRLGRSQSITRHGHINNNNNHRPGMIRRRSEGSCASIITQYLIFCHQKATMATRSHGEARSFTRLRMCAAGARRVGLRGAAVRARANKTYK